MLGIVSSRAILTLSLRSAAFPVDMAKCAAHLANCATLTPALTLLPTDQRAD